MVFIGLGSNLGDCAQNLAYARQFLTEVFKVSLNASAVYRSAPVEVTDQPWYMNQVISFPAVKEIGPWEILGRLKEIEARLGRIPTYRYGPRQIDLDLLFYRNWVLETSFLSIPHPKIPVRSFVLMPMEELAPDLVHPIYGQTVRELCEKLRKSPDLWSDCEKL